MSIPGLRTLLQELEPVQQGSQGSSKDSIENRTLRYVKHTKFGKMTAIHIWIYISKLSAVEKSRLVSERFSCVNAKQWGEAQLSHDHAAGAVHKCQCLAAFVCNVISLVLT